MRWFLLLLPFVACGFRESPKNETVLLGHDVLFRCAAQKSKDPEIYSQWKSSSGSLLGFHDAGRLAGHRGRYSYVKDTPEELHLRIERVTLEDNGPFECQMLRPEEGPFRAIAHLDVIVAPTEVDLANYQAGSSIDVNEGTNLNISCVVPNAKPQAKISWFINGRRIEDGVHSWNTYNLNKTVNSHAALHWKPRRTDHKKVLTCLAEHDESSTRIQTNLTLSVLFPPDKPRVTILGGDSFVRAGDNVSVLCVVSGGNPPPSLIWYNNDRAIGNMYSFDVDSQETRNTYSFLAAPDDHMAAYECRASNREGLAPQATAIHIKVAYAPKGVDLYGETSIRLGEATKVQCKTKPSNPSARISWLVNGHPVPASVQSEHHHKLGTISVSNITVNSQEVGAGKHRVTVECLARNDEGVASKQHVIKILAPPMAPRISGMEAPHYIEGDVVNVTCEAVGGNPLADLVWYKGYEKINGARSAVSGDATISYVSLVMERAMNGQKLKCEASNAALDQPLADTRQINVLFGPRRVTIRPVDTVRPQLLAGKEARLVCHVSSANPPPEVTWQLFPNGESTPLVYTGHTTINDTTRASGSILENVVSFVPLEVHDGTLARCVASHPLWPSSKNVTYALNVYYPPRLLVDSPISIVVSEGDSFRENLTVKGNPSVSAWRWRKDGHPFDHTIGSVFARGATLSGRNLKNKDAGIYTLFATNSVGTANVTINLTVEYSARITSISSPIIASSGETVVLECEADGEPRKPGMITWLRDGKEISSTRYGDTRAVLRLNASQETAGQYVCSAFNGVGEPGSDTAYVLVNTAPHMLKLPSISKAAGPLGGRARARCQAHAVPGADFVWDRNGQLINGNSSKFSVASHQINYSTFESTLWINNLVPEDYKATIRCTARNSLGTDSIKVPLGPQSPPDVPLEVLQTNATSTTLSVMWTAAFDGGSDQTFEVRYRKEDEDVVHGVNTSHTNVRISGLEPARIYHFQVRAINARGFSSDLTRPAMAFATLNADGEDVVSTKTSQVLPKFANLALIVGVISLIMCNCICLCFLQKKKRRKKIQEKTEMIRTAINGDGVRPVQMYGTMMQSEGGLHIERDEIPDVSEDDHSVRTMIEVNPNGYMQQIDPALYERNCLVEYEFDPREYATRQGTLGRAAGSTYTTVPYPEPPMDHYASLSRRQLQTNNNHSPHHLSTFIQPGGVRPGPIHYSELEGDLV